MNLAILYRGPLSSCNYDCAYCPFAKHRSPPEELLADQRGLDRFVSWLADARDHAISVLFTPWGEALVRRWYREAIVELSHLPHLRRVAIQTNLSGGVGWLSNADREVAALWTTFHPSEVDYDRFLDRCAQLCDMRVRFSVGIVGTRENVGWARRLRRDLPDAVYVWVNAYKSEGPSYYAGDEVAAFTAIDPLFPLNNQRHASRGHHCQAGYRSFTVDGDGTVRRCHFIGEALGNLYTDPLADMLARRPCTNDSCGCHIGYVHLDRLRLGSVFGAGLLERIPHRWPS